MICHLLRDKLFWRKVCDLLPKRTDGVWVVFPDYMPMAAVAEPLQYYLRELRRLCRQLISFSPKAVHRRDQDCRRLQMLFSALHMPIERLTVQSYYFLYHYHRRLLRHGNLQMLSTEEGEHTHQDVKDVVWPCGPRNNWPHGTGSGRGLLLSHTHTHQTTQPHTRARARTHTHAHTNLMSQGQDMPFHKDIFGVADGRRFRCSDLNKKVDLPDRKHTAAGQVVKIGEDVWAMCGDILELGSAYDGAAPSMKVPTWKGKVRGESENKNKLWVQYTDGTTMEHQREELLIELIEGFISVSFNVKVLSEKGDSDGALRSQERDADVADAASSGTNSDIDGKATNATNTKKKKATGTPEGGKNRRKHKAVTIDEPSDDSDDSAAYNTTPTKEKKGGKEKKEKTCKTSASRGPRGKVVTETEVDKIAEEICEKGPDAVILTKEWGQGSMLKLLKKVRLWHTKSASAKELRSQLKRELEAGLREPRTIPLAMLSDSLVYKPILGATKPIVRPENTYEARKSKSSEDEDSNEEEDEKEEEDEDNEDDGKLVTPPIPMSKLRMPTFPKPQGVDLLEEFDAAAAPPEPVQSPDAELCSEVEAPEKVGAPPDCGGSI